jgi:hypothetical protein
MPGAVGAQDFHKDYPQAPPPPVGFSSIVGIYDIEVSAEPTELHVGDVLLLTVRISGRGPAAYAPKRDLLRIIPRGMENDFFITLLEKQIEPAKAGPDFQAEWVFFYHLRPRHVDVEEVPSLPLVYYLPGAVKRPYQTASSSPIALTVKPRPEAKTPDAVRAALQVPESCYELASGSRVLRTWGVGWLSPALLLAGLLLPPVACAAWYIGWRRRHPDPRRQAWLRRRRAASQALLALQDPGVTPAALTATLAGYLRQRWEVPGAEPTPREVEEHLHRLGVGRALRRQAVDVLQACDAGRFDPAAASAPAIAQAAAQLIHALEKEACVRQPD